MGQEELKGHSIESYLQVETETGVKWEYYEGELVNMAGGTPNHALVQMTMGLLMGKTLMDKGSKYRIYSSDLKIAVEKEQSFLYPDLSVFCEDPIESAEVPNSLINPKIIVEVISESSEGRDRGKKFQLYRELPSLDTYILLSQYGPLVEVFTKVGEDVWTFRPALGPTEIIELPSLGIEIVVKDIYEGIKYESPDGSEVNEVYGIYMTAGMTPQ